MRYKRLLSVLSVSVLAGHALGHLDVIHSLTSRAVASMSAQSAAQSRDPNALPPAIPPVPNPPLYPDPPQSPMHWKSDDIQKIYQARVAYQKANPDQGFGGGQLPPETPRFRGATFRTHWMTGLLYRAPYSKPRPSNVTGRMSMYDDADQHQGAADFYVVTGGGGRMIVGGVIENREYGRMPPSYNPGNAQPLRPGEFNGQPIVGGRTFVGKAGDWVIIPPNAPHWWQVDQDGMGYLMMKVNIGIYPRGLIH